jgi:hypothetical protein
MDEILKTVRQQMTEALTLAIERLMSAAVKRSAPQIAAHIIDAEGFTLDKSGLRDVAIDILSDWDFSDELNREQAEIFERTRLMFEDSPQAELSAA